MFFLVYMFKVVIHGGLGSRVVTFGAEYTSVRKESLRTCSHWRCQVVAVVVYGLLQEGDVADCCQFELDAPWTSGGNNHAAGTSTGRG